MTADRVPPARMDDVERDYRRLPPEVRLEDTIAAVDPEVRPDPLAGRNDEHHRALRDD